VVPEIPDRPSADQVHAAIDLLIDLNAEFPFADAASLANALAILLTLLLRPVISGHVPLAIVDAPVQGTGKTLMVTATGIVGVGMVSGESVPDGPNDDEWRKKITSVLLKGPPLVLLDWDMPGMDGVEVLAWIRADERLQRLPVIALTAHAMAGDRERLLAAGFDEYISKPIVDEGVLLEAIARLLDRKRRASPVAVPARTCVEPARKAEAGLRVAVAS
jgi:CheY-like chemotaxis protein